jgi:predicted metalloprotease with PDZ domain
MRYHLDAAPRREACMTRRSVGFSLLAVSVVAGACSTPPAPVKTNAFILLAVDASDVGRKLYQVHETIPASPGPLTLVYPKWLPGEHAPTGPITDLVGLSFSAGTNGTVIPWHRDDVDMYAFHLDVPAGAAAVEAQFQFLSALGTAGFSSAASATPHLAVVTWNQLLLYPEGAKTDEVQIRASLTLPAGWQFGTALVEASDAGAAGARVAGRPIFAPVSLTTLVDSPVLAGEFFKAVPIDAVHHKIELDLAADSAAALAISPELTGKLERLVAEADALFGARHFEDYHFLLSLSDHVAHFGLEHHQSNDSRVYEKAVVDQAVNLGVLSHEFVHSWNGKYRRPAGLATPDFQAPMKGELLWVYEGLTQYLGNLLAARSGLWTDQYYKERLAEVAAYLNNLPGRGWRPLEDTTTAAQLLYAAPAEWAALRRGTDFYDEGWLIWLDADTKIRELSHGQKSLDDFCRLFHGGPSGAPMVKPYGLDDVVSALNAVTPFDWKTFLNDRVSKPSTHAPLDGIGRGGWSLVYNDTRNLYNTLVEQGELKKTEAGYSLGLWVKDDGAIIDVVGGSSAFRAGLGPGMKVMVIGGKKWSPDALREAIAAATRSKQPMTLAVDNDGVVKVFTLDYHDGLREPHLERIVSAPDVLHDILAPQTKGGK